MKDNPIIQKRWFLSEIEFLREHYPELPMHRIGKILNRSYKSIESQIRRLKLYSKNRKRERFLFWSPDEIRFLKEKYSKLSLVEIARILHRSVRSVESKSRRLKLRQQAICNIEPLNLTETEKAYIAGLLDGEGNVNISIIRRHGKPLRVIPQVEISNTNKEVLEWIAERVNQGNRRISRLRRYTDHRFSKPLDNYYLSISGRLAIEPFLQALLPYLHIKKLPTECLFKFLKSHIPFEPYTLEDWQNILRLRETINSRKDAHIESRRILRHFVKELEQTGNRREKDFRGLINTFEPSLSRETHDHRS